MERRVHISSRGIFLYMHQSIVMHGFCRGSAEWNFKGFGRIHNVYISWQHKRLIFCWIYQKQNVNDETAEWFITTCVHAPCYIAPTVEVVVFLDVALAWAGMNGGQNLCTVCKLVLIDIWAGQAIPPPHTLFSARWEESHCSAQKSYGISDELT